MTVRWFILMFVLSLLSCQPKDHFDIEMVSYYWLMNQEIQKDTMVPYVKCEMYAQINKNGECRLTRTRYPDSDLHLKCTISQAVLKPVLNIVESLNADTIMTEPSQSSLYDGPTIKVIGLNGKGHAHHVKFIHSKRSNPDLVVFYNYMDSISKSAITTDPFMKAKEERMKEIYDSEIKRVPIILKDEEVSVDKFE